MVEQPDAFPGSTIGQPVYLLRPPSFAVLCGQMLSNAVETCFRIKQLPLNHMQYKENPKSKGGGS